MGREKLTLISVLALIAFGAFGSAPAWGTERIFNAELSLRGDCETTSLDTVPDPGCPGGTHPGAFVEPLAALVDSHGDLYVSSIGKGGSGRIDIFNPSGIYLTGFEDPRSPESLALDSEGNLYVAEFSSKAQINRYHPIKYNPAAEEIEYPSTPTSTVIDGKEGSFFLALFAGLAVDPKDDHLFVDLEKHVSEYDSATEGNKLLDATIGEGTLDTSKKIAIDGVRRRLYVSDGEESAGVIRVFELDSPHKQLKALNGSNVPAEKFITPGGFQSIAVDEETGEFFIDDINGSRNVYGFDENYEYLSTYTHSLEGSGFTEIEVDNGPASSNKGALFVPSIKKGPHVFVFKAEPPPTSPLIKVSIANVTEGEAELLAGISPNGSATSYRIEYTTQQSFEAEGYAGASNAALGTLAAGNEDTQVSAPIAGLLPGTAYRFRAVAENAGGTSEDDASFTTFGETPPLPLCPNDALRVGLSSDLPDCRAFELVTPPNTGGREPRGVGFVGNRFPTREASRVGGKVSFLTEGGSLPGSEGTGTFNGDPYLATRGPSGWSSASAGPNGFESEAPLVGSVSPDQGYSFWSTGGGLIDHGSRIIDKEITSYVRYPDGDSELIGRGSLAVDPHADGSFISEDGTHIVFQTTNFLGHIARQLEPNAPPDGTPAVYDRTPNEVTHVVSLLPGNVTPSAGPGGAATYVGASPEGNGIAFTIGGTLYLRFRNEETYEVGKGVTFAGVAEGGARIFYVEGGDLFALDVETEERLPFTESGDATTVNVSLDGTAAYFVSPSVLTGEEENPNGAVAQKGAENLYLSEEGSIRFLATVTTRDVEGESRPDGQSDGLGLWTYAMSDGRLAKDPSRTTPDGGVLLFESRADLAGYDPEGHAEVYRYDSGASELTCLSCIPTDTPATGNASLESMAPGQGAEQPFSAFGYVPNLRSDGRRAFFQSPEGLVPADTDGLLDVYEWEAGGVGSCERESGCVYLASSGHSYRNDYLYGVSDSGDDVFFQSWDLLTGSDAEATPSIYDARVEGGFPEEAPKICQGEGCRPRLTPPPPLPVPQSGVQGSGGNVTEPKAKTCPKGKRRVKRHGKVHCVKKHHRGSSRGKKGKK